MSDRSPEERLAEVQAWWNTGIIDIHPGKISVRGYAIQDLIGQISFPQMIWLMLRGDLPTLAQAKLLEAALVASVDHGPHAPSIAIARIASTTESDKALATTAPRLSRSRENQRNVTPSTNGSTR